MVFEFDDTASVVISIFLLLIVRKEHFTHSTLSQFSLKYEFLSWILLNELNFVDDAFELFCREDFRLDFTLFELNFVTRNHVSIIIRLQRVVKSDDKLLGLFVSVFLVDQLNFYVLLEVRWPQIKTRCTIKFTQVGR